MGLTTPSQTSQKIAVKTVDFKQNKITSLIGIEVAL